MRARARSLFARKGLATIIRSGAASSRRRRCLELHGAERRASSNATHRRRSSSASGVELRDAGAARCHLPELFARSRRPDQQHAGGRSRQGRVRSRRIVSSGARVETRCSTSCSASSRCRSGATTRTSLADGCGGSPRHGLGALGDRDRAARARRATALGRPPGPTGSWRRLSVTDADPAPAEGRRDLGLRGAPALVVAAAAGAWLGRALPDAAQQRARSVGLRARADGSRVPLDEISLAADVDPFAFLRLVGVPGAPSPDVMHTHLVHADVYGQLAGAAARVPIRVSTKHGFNEFRENPGFGSATARSRASRTRTSRSRGSRALPRGRRGFRRRRASRSCTTGSRRTASRAVYGRRAAPPVRRPADSDQGAHRPVARRSPRPRASFPG